MEITAGEPRKRASAAIVKDGKILLMRRVKPDHEYYIVPGGGIEEGETPEDALAREVMEELTLKVIHSRFLVTVDYERWPSYATSHTGGQRDFYFLVEQYEGVPEIGGPEKERMSEENQYHIVWLPIGDLGTRVDILPQEGARRLAQYLSR